MPDILLYLLIYLALGAPVTLVTALAMADKKLMYFLFVWPTWPLWSIAAAVTVILKAISIFQARRCIWCDEVVKLDRDLFKLHVMECKQNPAAILMRKYRRALVDISCIKSGEFTSQLIAEKALNPEDKTYA
jgi:hypothetical protein